MQVTNYYLQLRTSFNPYVEGEPQRVTLDELAAALFCTTRNVKLLLKKMTELGWILWEPGRGRGNASTITFLVPAGEIISKEAVELAQKGEFKSAMELINRYGDRYPLKESFVEWLFSYFGYKAEEKGERRLDSLRFPVFRPIETLDPIHAFFANDANVIDNIFDTLVSFNTTAKTIEPRLAHYWESNEERNAWTFYLRKTVKFHHGRELTAYDVKFSLLRLMSPTSGSINQWLMDGVNEIVVLNRTTLRIELKRPNYMFLQHLTEVCTAIVPEEICREHGDLFARLPIGTGPFRIDSHDEYICRLRAFDDYFGERPYLDQVELWVLPEAMPLWSKKPMIVHTMCDNEPLMVEPFHVQSQQPGWERRQDELPGCTLLTFNLQAPGPQRHAKFREAVDLLIDREAMVRELGGNRIRPAYSFWIQEENESECLYDTDLERAKELLDEIGYDGTPLRLYSYRNDPSDLRWICDRCAQAGIRIEYQILNRDEMKKPQRIAEADMIFYGVVLEGLEFSMLGIFMQTTSYIGAHLSRELRESVEEDVKRLQQTPSEQERYRMLKHIEKGLKEQRAFLFVLHSTLQLEFHESVKGVTVNALGWVDFRKLIITQPDMAGNEYPLAMS